MVLSGREIAPSSLAHKAVYAALYGAACQAIGCVLFRRREVVAS